jgi:hypothetical protein
MALLEIRVFHFSSICFEIANKDKLSQKWMSSLYEKLFLEDGVKEIITFQETLNLEQYSSPVKELIHGLEQYFDYKDNEKIIFLV